MLNWRSMWFDCVVALLGVLLYCVIRLFVFMLVAVLFVLLCYRAIDVSC